MSQDRPATRPTSVFEWMERLKMPALWVCVFIMGGFAVIGLFGDLFQRGSREEVQVGQFSVPGGGTWTYTNIEFEEEAQQTLRRVHSFAGGRGVAEYPQLGARLLMATVRDQEEFAWMWLVLEKAAQAAGIVITDEVFVDRANEAGEEITLHDYQRRFDSATREVQRELAAIREFRRSMDLAQPEATWDTLYERFKTTYEDLRASYVLFDTEETEIAFDPKENAEDRAKLEQWLTENPGIRSQKRIPEALDARVLYVRFKDASTEELKRQYGERWAPLVAELGLEVSDEKLRQRFDVFRSAWDAPLREAAQAFENVEGDKPTEFEMIKERLRIEALATMLAEKAFEEVTREENPLSFEDVAQKYGFRLTQVSNLDSRGIQQHVDFASPRAANPMLQGLREKTLEPGDVYRYEGDPSVARGPVEEPGSSVAIWQLQGYRPERDATLDDPGMLEHFTEEYKKKRRQDLAKEEAEAFRKAVEERVDAAVAEKERELEAEMLVAVDRRIAEAGLDRNDVAHKPRILEIENDERQRKQALLDEERARVEPSVFLAVAAERFLTVRNTGWIPKTTSRNASFQAAEDLTTGEKAERFFRKSARRLALAGVKPGRMGQVESEPAWYVAAVPLLLEKRQPDPDDIYDLSRSQLDQLRNQVSPSTQTQQFWSYENFKRPEWFDLNVPAIEEGIKDKLKSEQERAEKQRLREERQRNQDKARAERAARDALQVRPLFSGEDW